MSFSEEYVQNFDVEDYISQFIDVRRTNKSNIVGTSCPLCGSTKKDKFYVNKSGGPKNGLWSSYCCHDSGNLVKLVAAVENITDLEAVHLIKSFVDGEDGEIKPIQPETIKDNESEVKQEPVGAEFPSQIYNVTPDTPMVVDGSLQTVLARGVNDYIIQRHNIMMTGQIAFYANKIRPELANRLLIPIADETGKFWISWQARDMAGVAERKYLFPINDQSTTTFYGWHQAKELKTVLIVEGAAHKWSFDNTGRELGSQLIENMAIASFGKKLTTEQENLLISSNVEHVILAWDLDAAEQTKRVATILNGRKKVSIMLPPEDGRDWDQLSHEERLQSLSNIEPFSLNLMAKMTSRLALIKASKR